MIGGCPEFDRLNQLATEYATSHNEIEKERLKSELLGLTIKFFTWELKYRHNKYRLAGVLFAEDDLASGLTARLLNRQDSTGWLDRYSPDVASFVHYLRSNMIGEIQHMLRGRVPASVWDTANSIIKESLKTKKPMHEVMKTRMDSLQATPHYQERVEDTLVVLTTPICSLEDPTVRTEGGDAQTVGERVECPTAEEDHEVTFHRTNRSLLSRKLRMHKKHKILFQQLLEGVRFHELDFGEPLDLGTKAVRVGEILTRLHNSLDFIS